MLKIGEFSKLSLLTVKALRFYEKEGLLVPAKIDKWSGYRFYDTTQLQTAAKIKSLPQLDFSIGEIKAYLSGAADKRIFDAKAAELHRKQDDLSVKLSIIKFLSEDEQMK